MAKIENWGSKCHEISFPRIWDTNPRTKKNNKGMKN
jgi:hypothetical protein